MKCPYQEDFNCPFVDTAAMDKTTSCFECEYNYKSEIDDWNEFMMGL